MASQILNNNNKNMNRPKSKLKSNQKFTWAQAFPKGKKIQVINNIFEFLHLLFNYKVAHYISK